MGRASIDTNTDRGVGFVSVRRDGTVVGASRAIEDLLGYEQEEMRCGLHWSDIAVPPAGEAGACELVPTAAVPTERVMVAKDGHPVRVLVGAQWDDDDRATAWVVPVATGKGEVEAQLDPGSSQRLLLERERSARADAEAANRMKDEFLATLSHELRTPLNAIVGWAHLLAQGKLGEADRQRGIAAIQRNARAQAQLVDDLLDLSRIITGKLGLALEPVQMVDVVAAALDTVRPAAIAKGVELRCARAAPAGLVVADAARMQQVMWNLLSNAVKFTPAGGHVEAHLENVGDQLEIRITDDGRGIAPELLPYVFDRFRQADGSSTRADSGLGLGLAIVRQLVELHGGAVEAASQGLGRGATFIVRLPLLAGASSAPRTDACPDSGAGWSFAGTTLARVKVLAVVADPKTLEAIRVPLVAHGAEIVSVHTSASALATLRRWTPDVIISDVVRPDGFDFLRELRASSESAGSVVPAIAITPGGGPDRTRDVLLAGYQVHVPNPVDPGHLVSAVYKLWRRRKRA